MTPRETRSETLPERRVITSSREPVSEILDLKRLRYFIVAAEEGSFRRAAKLLYGKQPTLSAAIKRLEHKLDVVLFERLPRETRLTAAGSVLLEEGRSVLHAVDDIARHVGRAARGGGGRLGIGFFTSLASGVLAQVVADYAGKPDTSLALWEGSRRHQLAVLRDRHIDVGLMLAPVHAADLVQETLWHEPVVAALPANHLQATAATLTWRDLAEEAFIVRDFEHDRSIEEFVRRRTAKAGFVPRVAHRVISRETLLGLVRAGHGVGVVPESSTGLHPDRVRFVPLASDDGTLRIVSAWRPENANPALPAFLDALRSVAKRLGRDQPIKIPFPIQH